MLDAVALDHHGLAILAGERVGHGDDGLQRIALRAAGGRRVSGPARCAGGIVGQLLDRLGGNATAAVMDDDFTRFVLRGVDVDLDRRAGGQPLRLRRARCRQAL